MEESDNANKLTLVIRKPGFGLPISCPDCLPVYIYLRLARIPFSVEHNLVHTDSDQLPFVEYGDSVAYNNEKGGVIQCLKEDQIVDLDSEVSLNPDWVSAKAMVKTCLAEAAMYELWVAPEGSTSAHKVYYSDLPWPIGKCLYWMKAYKMKRLLGIGRDNAERRKEEIYRRATDAYRALSAKLGEQAFFFEDRPTSLDAEFIGHVLFTLYALPKTSVLRSKLLEHDNFVFYADGHKMRYIDSAPEPQPDPSSSAPKRGSETDEDYGGRFWTEEEYWESSEEPEPPFVPEPDQPCTYIVYLKFPDSGQPENLEEWCRSFIPKDVVLEPPRWFIASNPKYHVGFSALLTALEVEAMERENKTGFRRAFMEGPLVLDEFV